MILAPRAITRSADHQYTFQGDTYPGVTNVLKVIDKSDALMSWAARQTAEAAIGLAQEEVDNVSSLNRLLATVGPEGTVKALTSRSAWKRDEAAQLGTDVHNLADQYVRGLSPVIPEHAEAHVAAYAAWWSAANWKIRATEAFVLQPTHGYGGTLDVLAYDADGRTVLADIKTGRGVYSEAVLQLTAYGDATLLQTQEGVLYDMPKVDRYVILHVTRENVREIEVSVGTLERMAWAGCMDLYAWHRTVKGKRL